MSSEQKIDYFDNYSLEGQTYKVKVHIDKHNEIIKLLEYKGDLYNIAKALKSFAKNQDIGKIVAFIYSEEVSYFIANGYFLSGTINGFFRGKSASCMSYFMNKERFKSENIEKENSILYDSLNKKLIKLNETKNNLIIKTPAQDDISNINKLFQGIYKIYHEYIDSSQYIKNLIYNKNILYKIAKYDDKIIGIIAAYIDLDYLNAKINDCIILEEFKSANLLSLLISNLELDVENRGVKALYSFPRAMSININNVLGNLGYRYTGRFINNYKIAGTFEDINIWVKNKN